MHVRTINMPTCHFAQWSVRNSMSELLSCGRKEKKEKTLNIGNVLILQSCRCGWFDSIKKKTSSDGNVGFMWVGGFVHMLRMWGNTLVSDSVRSAENYLQICLIRTILSGSATAWTWEDSQGQIFNFWVRIFRKNRNSSWLRRRQKLLGILRTRMNYLLSY